MIRRIKRIYSLLVLLLSLALVAGFLHFATADGSPAGDTHLRLLSFNVFSLGRNAGSSGRELILDGIVSIKPDVVVLQECPLGRTFTYVEQRLAEAGLIHVETYSYGRDEYAGMALFSRFPLKASRRAELITCAP